MKRIIITTGEPAGIGPDVVVTAAQRDWPAQLVAIGDSELLKDRAAQLGIDLTLSSYNTSRQPSTHIRGNLAFIHLPMNVPCRPGELNPDNASYVLAQLELAAHSCLTGDFSAMVTAPVQKSVINAAGFPFTGQTEFIGQLSDGISGVMLLMAPDIRIALATTHLPLREVPDRIEASHLEKTIITLHRDLRNRFCISNPRITVLGLNPHAGEDGYLGSEEIEVIQPACEALRHRGLDILGPISADTAFISGIRERTDAYLAMYHDQALPVLKTLGFHETVNVTLGLPFVRTSVDHGTALSLAGSGAASDRSMLRAIDEAITLSPE